MKKVYLLLVLMLGLGVTFNTMAQRSFYGEQAEKPSQHTPELRFGDIIYDQSADEQYGGYIVSQFFTDEASAELSSQGADDFEVPAGETWTVGSFGVWGTWWADSDGNPEKINVYIYEDSLGQPYTNPIDFYEEQTGFYAEEWYEDEGNGDVLHGYYNFTFPSPIAFTEGHYWISFQVHDSYDKVGQFGWDDKTNENWEVYHWRNPGGGFLSGTATNWVPSTATSPFGYSLDFRFTLYGEAYDNDIACLAITSPETGTLTATETVTMTIKNQGNNTQTGFDVGFQVDGGAWVVENVETLELLSEGTADYTFTATADLSVTGFHTLACKTMLTGDEQPANDELMIDLTNYGEVYPMVNNDTIDYETCTGTFTDMGGVDGDIMAYDNGVVTFLPEAGKKMQLDFFGVWDISHQTGGVDPFQIYDGPDMDSPLIGEWTQNDWRDFGLKPGVIKALGETGALTVRYLAPGWITNPPFPEGWTALISCYEQSEDDFAVTDFFVEPTLLFTDRDVTFTATVRNLGSIAKDKDVTFYVNGAAIGSVNTGSVEPAAFATVSYVHQFTAFGDVTLKAAVPEDLGTSDDNYLEIENFVYLNGWFVEMFDDGFFPPENWDPGNAWQGGWSGYESPSSAQCNIPTFTTDTLVSPKLVIHEGDILTFMAVTSNWWPGSLEVLWIDGETGEAEQLLWLGDFTLSSQWRPFEVDVSAAAGENYIAFVDHADVTWSWSGDVSVDRIIGIGIEFFYNDNDMKMAEFNPDPTPSKNTPIDYDVTVKNNGLNAMADGDYTVKIMQITEDGDVEMGSVPGIACASLQEKTHTISVTFDQIGPAEVYAVVDLVGDEDPNNNTSLVVPVYVQVDGTGSVEIGPGEDEAWQIPCRMGSSWVVSEVIYNADLFETDVTGFMTGIAYEYNNTNTAPTENMPIIIYVGETELDHLGGGSYINGSEMTKVAEVHRDFPIGLNQQLYIPFLVPFDYQGGNLCVMFFMPSDGGYYQGVNWIGTDHGPVPDSTAAYSTSYNPPINPENLAGLQLNYVPFMPNTTFYLGDVGTANLSGFVFDENAVAFEGVKVQVVGFDNETTTAANGSYSFTGLLAWENLIRATQFGYFDNDQSIVLFEGEANTLNINMELLPQVMVYGKVTGADDWGNHWLEGAVVTLEGYENYETTVDAEGNYSFENVYGSKTYTATYTYPGYQTYVNSNVQVTDVDKNLYTTSLQELKLSPFYTQIEQTNPGTVMVNWLSPLDGVAETLTYDYYINNGYTAELGEEVWLGNIYEDVPAGTITQINTYWAQYWETSDTVRLDIMDDKGDIYWSSERFITEHDAWVNVDVPNITWEGGDLYAMLYWDGMNAEFTDYLAADVWELGLGINYAYIMYPGDLGPSMLSDLLESDITFQIDVEMLVDGGGDGTRYNEGYNILRGPWSDVNNWESWTPINDEPVMGNEYYDGTWPQMDGYTYGVQTVYTQGTSEPAFAMPIDHNPDLPCEQPWDYLVTGSVHTISVPATAGANVYGEPLVEGDWVGVFFTDENGDEVCGGAGMIDESGAAVVTAYGDDPLTDEKDGFDVGERFIWRMHVCETWTEYPAGGNYDMTKPNQGYFATFGLSALTSLEVMVCQYYSFTTGWNSISSYITPFDTDVEVMFAPIVDDMIIMRNLTQVYWPGEEINTIGDFDNGNGYALKLTADNMFEVCGPDFVDGELMIGAGWSYIPTLSECSVNAMDLFGNNLDDIVIITDLIGTQVFWPAQGVYTLETLDPGKAYRIKAVNEFTVTFPECDAKATTPAFSQVNTINTIWGDVNMTPSTEVVAFQASATVDFIEGDVIGAFGQNGQLYGFMTVNGAGVAQAISLFGDDVTSIDQDGFTEGETVSYKLYRGATGETYELNVVYDNTMDNVSGNYYTGSFAAIRAITMGITGIGSVNGGNIDMYPNPATDMVYISLSNVEYTEATVVIYDTEGRQVINQVINGQAELNVSSLEAGIYFVKINNTSISEIRKLVIK